MQFSETTTKALMSIGMNNLEAVVYLALLREPAITGYRAAKITGKAAPNVYQALESLTKKGAVVLHIAERQRRYSAVPVREMISGFKADFEARTEALENELKGFDIIPSDNGIFRIDNETQLFSRIEDLLAQACLSVLFTADTEFIVRFRKPLSEAGGRGVRVLVLAFESMDIENCDNLKLTPGQSPPWPGKWIVLDIDGCQHVIAFFEKPGTLTHAIWCNDQCLSFWMHFGLLADFTLMHFFEETRDRPDYGEMRDRLHAIYWRYNSRLLPTDKELPACKDKDC